MLLNIFTDFVYGCAFDLSTFVFLLFQVSLHLQRLSSVWRRICWTAAVWWVSGQNQTDVVVS